jgi:PAS domain S-box-containing protein
MSEQALRLLLIEGNKARLEEIEKALRSEARYFLDIATEAKAAVRLVNAAEEPYDTVIIDDALLCTDGRKGENENFHLMSIIRNHLPLAEILVFNRVAQRANAAEQDQGLNYLPEPFELTALVAQIRQISEKAKRFTADNGEKGTPNSDLILQLYTNISSSLDLKQTLNSVCQSAVQMMKVEHSGLVLFDARREKGEVRAEYPEIGAAGLQIPLQGVDAEEKLIETQEPLVVFDVENESLLGPVREILKSLNIHSILIVPVVGKSGLLGSFSLDSIGRKRKFTKREIEFCKVFAAHVAVVIENAKSFEGVSRRVEQLDALRQTVLAITSPSESEQSLQTIVKKAIELLNGKSGGIYEFDSALNALRVVADYNREAHIGRTLKVGEGMAGRLVESNAPYMIVDNYNEWEGKANIYDEERRFGAVLEVPFKWEGNTIGILYVDDEVGRKFTEDDALLLTMFANHAAVPFIARFNQSLSARDTAKLKRLERLSEVCKEFLSDLDTSSLEDRLNLIAKYATEILRAEVCGVMLVREDGELYLEASYGHREGRFQKGKRFTIRSGQGTGLTGHIAAEGSLFNLHGEALINHFAVRGIEPDCTPSGRCTSLLAIPLKKKTSQDEKLVGLLRAANKRGKDGRALPTLSFSKEDEWLLNIFAEAVVIAIDSAALVAQLGEQKIHQSLLIESSPNGIISVDSEGAVSGYNEKAREIFGYNSGEDLPAHVRDLYFDPNEPWRIGEKIGDNKDGKLKNYHTAIKSKDKRPIPIRLSACWLKNAKGERIGSVGYFEDLRSIQEGEKRYKLLLQAGDVVERANSLKEGLQHLAEMVVSLLSSTFCRILIYDENRSSLTVEAAYPITRSNGKLNWEAGIGNKVLFSDYDGLREFLEAGKTKLLRMSNKKLHPNLEKFSNRLHLEDSKVQSLLMVPLKISDEIVGLLDVGEVRDPNRSPFSDEKKELARRIGTQLSFLIKRRRLLEIAERRRELLTALDEKVRYLKGEKQLKKLWQEAMRLSVELVSANSGALFAYHHHTGKLESVATYNLNLPPESSLLDEDGIVGLVARMGQARIIHDYSSWPEREDLFASYGFQTVVGVPLKQAEGNVSYVLLVAAKEGDRAIGEAEIEILERFAAQISIAIQTSEMIGGGGQSLAYLKILHQVSEFILSTNNLDWILDAVLTGITAGYGLGFNRAVLFLLDERGENLVGRRGIGDWNKENTEASWQRDLKEGLYDFYSYFKRLKSNAIRPTPMGAWAQSFNMALGRTDYFSRAVREGRSFCLRADQLPDLPKSFINGFKPMTELAIIPVSVNGASIGVLVIDNNITKSPITEPDIEAILTFANTAALAIDKTKLWQSVERGHTYLRSLFEASNALSTSEDPQQVLEDIIDRTQEVVGATWVRVILTDESQKPRQFISKGSSENFKIENLLRAGGTSERALQTGTIQIIEDTEQQRDLVNPETVSDRPETRLCVPLVLGGKKLGVMWIGYAPPRSFTELEKEALQLYVNQAAIAYDSARRINELVLMRQAAEALAGEADSEGVLKQILDSAHNALQADSAALWPYDAEHKNFIGDGWIGRGISDEIKEKFWKAAPRPGGTANRVMEDGWVSVKDVNDSKEFPYIGDSTRNLLALINARSFLGIALVVGDEKLGVLYLNYERTRSFSDEELQTARTFANHAALALKKARLVEQLSKITQAAEAVAEVTVLGDLKATLNLIVRVTREALNCDAVVLFEYDKDTRKVGHPPTMTGVRNEQAASRRKAERDSIVYKILLRDEPAFVERAPEAPLFEDSRFTKEEGVQSCVGIPLKFEQERVGVMFVNYWNTHHFTPDEEKNIKFFAYQAAIAIRNAQLYEARNKRLKEQKELVVFSEKLLGTLGFQETINAAVRAGTQMLDVEHCCIMLQDDNGEFTFSAAHGWSKDLIGNLKLGVGSQTAYTIQVDGPIIVTDYTVENRFVVHPIILQEKFRAGLSVPMSDNQGSVVGAMLIHTRGVRYFTDEEAKLLQLIANQTAIAMQSAREFERSQRKSAYLRSLHHASKAITASFSLNQKNAIDRYQVLNQIVRQAFDSIAPKAVLSNILLLDEGANELIFESIHPAQKHPDLVKKIGHRFPLDREKLSGGRIGINGRAALTGRTQLIADVRTDEDYMVFSPSTLSELTIPLKDESGKVLGTLNLESEQLSGFNNEDRAHLEALAELATIVIKNAEQFQELIKTKNMMDSSILLAVIGMGGADWTHTVRGDAINIRYMLTLLRDDITQWRLDEQKKAKLEERLRFIEGQALKIEDKGIVPPLSAEEGVELVEINELIRARLTQLLESDALSKVKCDLSELATEEIKVKVSREWFRRVLDILVNNAGKAMYGQAERKLMVASRLVGSRVVIEISDTGRGISPEYIEKLFKVRIDIPGRTKGLGIGLLMAQLIVRTYMGEIYLKETSDHGTTFVISLPAEK